MRIGIRSNLPKRQVGFVPLGDIRNLRLLSYRWVCQLGTVIFGLSLRASSAPAGCCLVCPNLRNFLQPALKLWYPILSQSLFLPSDERRNILPTGRCACSNAHSRIGSQPVCSGLFLRRRSSCCTDFDRLRVHNTALTAKCTTGAEFAVDARAGLVPLDGSRHRAHRGAGAAFRAGIRQTMCRVDPCFGKAGQSAGPCVFVFSVSSFLQLRQLQGSWLARLDAGPAFTQMAGAIQKIECGRGHDFYAKSG